MLKIVALLACIIGVLFGGPKALAEFRRARPGNEGSNPLAQDSETSKRQVA